ncbi:MAG: SDR family NAD(P)-dependent oxidoreductase [Bacteroidales bacterium]|nr:SDR family NAD(P)-dependent oxidoreductase [Bacteroidales bacterium]
MSALKKKYGHMALIAGASEGLGAAFSDYLAHAGFDLVLVARRQELLQSFALSMQEKYHTRVSAVCCDLSSADASDQLMCSVDASEIDVLVYNAALSFIGPFESDSPEHIIKIATTNMITPLKLVRVVGEEMLKKGRGAVILMSSLAGFQGSGFLSAYAATKAFNRILAESLWYEWRHKGVDVIACCAGATATNNYKLTNPGKTGLLSPSVQTPEQVVKECFAELGKKPSVVTGYGNRVANFLMQRLIPRKTAVRIMGDTTRKIYRI